MPQIIASIDEACVNLLFRKFYNALPALTVNRSVSRNGTAAGMNLQLSANAQARISPVDYLPTQSPVDLRGSSLVPPVKVGPMGFRVHVGLTAKATAGAFSAEASVPAEMLVNVNAGASVQVQNAGSEWRPRMRLQATSVEVELDGNKSPLQSAVDTALKQIDANGPLPGTPRLPAPVIGALVNLAGQAFDQLAPLLEEAIEQAIETMLGEAAIDVSMPVPKQFAMALPGGGAVQVNLANLTAVVTSSRVTVTADLS